MSRLGTLHDTIADPSSDFRQYFCEHCFDTTWRNANYKVGPGDFLVFQVESGSGDRVL